MMLLARIVVAIVANAAALLASSYFVPGFELKGDVADLAVIAFILTILNGIIKPVLRLILGPVIVITLGLGLVIVNAILLYILDILSLNLTIQTIPALIYSSLIFGLMNLIFHKAKR